MKNLLKKIFILFLFLIPFITLLQTNAQEEGRKFVLSFTGIGCPYCAKVAPELHKKVNEGKFILIEYEIYKNLANSQALNEYSQKYNLSLGIPQILLNKDLIESGDTPILSKIDQMVLEAPSNEIFLANGNSISFEEFSLNDLKRYPNIYSKDRVVMRKSLTTLTEKQDNQIKKFIYEENIEEALEGLEGKSIKAVRVENPGKTLTYQNAIEINGWVLQWNGESGGTNINGVGGVEIKESTSTVSLGRVITLGLADSVNPCALSVLALVLISIVTYNPGDRKRVLFAGLAFISAVLIMYLLYGFLIIKAFQVVQSVTAMREFLYGTLGINTILGVGAIILGVLGIKDFISYKPGSVGTEMPLFLRPKVNKIISKATSPQVAFVVGLFVTLFLLPCTIGPYIILGGLLANDGFVSAMPSLLLYNLIFVSPMLAVTMLVYIGSKKAEEVKDWKEKNVKYMHLVAGILLFIIGVLMVLGKF